MPSSLPPKDRLELPWRRREAESYRSAMRWIPRPGIDPYISRYLPTAGTPMARRCRVRSFSSRFWQAPTRPSAATAGSAASAWSRPPDATDCLGPPARVDPRRCRGGAGSGLRYSPDESRFRAPPCTGQPSLPIPPPPRPAQGNAACRRRPSGPAGASRNAPPTPRREAAARRLGAPARSQLPVRNHAAGLRWKPAPALASCRASPRRHAARWPVCAPRRNRCPAAACRRLGGASRSVPARAFAS